jgi:hypothetical protein
MQCASALQKILCLSDFVFHRVIRLGVLGLMVDWEGAGLACSRLHLRKAAQ